MLQEKEMVCDVLAGTKASMTKYAALIAECCDQNLRSTLQQMRNGDEQFQYNLAKIAEKKGYYKPSPTVQQTELGQLKSQLSSAMNMQ